MADPASSGALLDVSDLTVDFRTDDGLVQAVRGVDLVVKPGEVVAVVGESGSGKSVTAMSILGLLPGSAQIGGSVSWNGEELLQASPTRLRQVRGGEIAMIFQDPLTALNPVYRVGDQIVEMIQAHGRVSKQGGHGPGRRDARRSSASPSPTSGRSSTRTSSPAACASGP